MLFFFFCVVFNNFSTIPVEIDNARLQIGLVIRTDAPIIVTNNAIEMQPLVADK